MGGNDGHGWESVLIPRNTLLVTAYEKGWPAGSEIPKQYAFGSDKDTSAKQLSWNHWKMGINAELARAAAWGSLTEYQHAREVIEDWLDMEDHSWWLAEQCAGGAHPGMHLQAELIGLAAALHHHDDELAQRLDRQVQRALAVGLHASTSDGEVICIGERQEASGPVLPQFSAVFRIASELPPRGALAHNPHALQADSFWLAARMATAMRAKGELPPVPPMSVPLPAMRRRLSITRWGASDYRTALAGGEWAFVQRGNLVAWDVTGRKVAPLLPGGVETKSA